MRGHRRIELFESAVRKSEHDDIVSTRTFESNKEIKMMMELLLMWTIDLSYNSCSRCTTFSTSTINATGSTLWGTKDRQALPEQCHTSKAKKTSRSEWRWPRAHAVHDHCACCAHALNDAPKLRMSGQKRLRREMTVSKRQIGIVLKYLHATTYTISRR